MCLHCTQRSAVLNVVNDPEPEPGPHNSGNIHQQKSLNGRTKNHPEQGSLMRPQKRKKTRQKEKYSQTKHLLEGAKKQNHNCFIISDLGNN